MVIMPTGKNYYDWSLNKDEKVVKTAGKGKAPQAKDVRDALYEAAEKTIKNRKQAQCGGCGEIMSEVAPDALESAPVAEVDINTSPIAEENVEVEGIEGTEEKTDSSKVDAVIEEGSVALDQAKSAIDSLKGGMVDDEEVTIELPDDENAEFSIPGEEGEEVDEVSKSNKSDDEIPGLETDEVDEKPTDDDIVKKSDEGAECKAPCKPEGKSEGKKDKAPAKDKKDAKPTEEKKSCACASTIGEFTKLSMISPTTRKKVYTCWTEYLGYPKDYCKLLGQDSEKK